MALAATTRIDNAAPAAKRPPAIEIEAVGKVYQSSGGAVSALGSVTLDVRKGEFVSLLGPSGCGKTTLLRIVADLEHPTSGRVHLHGRALDGLGFVFQRDVLLNWRTIIDKRSAADRIQEQEGAGLSRARPRASRHVRPSGI
jgi:ABC-type nitrate/sulfonate/bicarbonate transport system ATPase subunit